LLELQAIGLADEDTEVDLDQPADDEICREIRSLQRRVGEATKQNNERRAKLRHELLPRVQSDALAGANVEAEKALERRYQKMLKRRHASVQKRVVKVKKQHEAAAQKLGLDAAFPLPPPVYVANPST
jgi:Skp family chaperone for outer membrane proteins